MNIVQNAKNIYVVGVTLYARHNNGNTGMSNKMQMISWSQPVLRQQFEYMAKAVLIFRILHADIVTMPIST